MKRLPVIPETLPCFPCPHNSVCCEHGTEVSPLEAQQIRDAFGENTIETLSPDEYRRRFQYTEEDPELENMALYVTTLKTTTYGPRCVFWDRGCSLYNSSSYPIMCRAFPWTDGLANVAPATDTHLPRNHLSHAEITRHPEKTTL